MQDYRPKPTPLDPLPEGERTEVLATAAAPDRPTPKSKAKSKTLWGIASAVAGVALMGLGLDGSSAELLADGIQPEDIGPILTTIGAAVTAWGLRTAERPVK